MAFAALLLGAAATALASCNDVEDPVAPPALLSRQPMKRFPVGSTFWLPAPAQGTWALSGAPAGNTNQLVTGQDGFLRFTPVVPGDYTFRFDGEDSTQTLTVVGDVPYEHYNYYPITSLAAVKGEVWVANVHDPHVSRIDPATGKVLGAIQTGPWPVGLAAVESQGVVLVAHKAGDTVGFVDIASGTLVDAVWVGDEPAAITVSPDGSKAYVSLSSEDAIAVVDIASRSLAGRVATNKFPGSLAISEDGSKLYVASYCSSVSDRLQFTPEPRNDMYDIAVVDTASLSVEGYIQAAGSVIGGLWLSGDRLYVGTTRVALAELSGDDGMTAFRHTVAAYDTKTLEEITAVDVGRQDSSTGLAVRPFGLTVAGDTLWTVFEGSDVVVGLDPETLAEKARFSAEGRPRAILAADDKLFVHGAQAYKVTIASASGAPESTAQLTGDPRPEGLAKGQKLYTGTGGGGGLNHSCADCHVDGLTDGNVWSAGGFSESTSRPMSWLEGPKYVGWEGDAYDLFSYLYGSPGPTIGATVDTELHQVFFDYMSEFVPPPAANGATERDGGMTAAALAGEELFRGKASCAGCHAGPMGTQGLRLDGGGTQSAHPIVVPGLVGVYRHGYWLVNGAAWTLDEAVDAMLPLSGATLTGAEKKSVVAYLEELTSRTFFVLRSTPKDGAEDIRSEGPMRLTFSHPVFDGAANLARIQLKDAGGAPVAAAIEVLPGLRHVTVTPDAPLDPGTEYELSVSAGFEAWNESALEATESVRFTVAAAPALKLEGDYELTVDHPMLDFVNKKYDFSAILPITFSFSATSTGYGATIDAKITSVLDAKIDVPISGEKSVWPPFPFPVGPGFLNRSFPTEMVLVDEDGDGIADSGESKLLLRSPGLEAKDVRWTIQRKTGPDTCDGQTGTNPVTVTLDAAGAPTVDWEAAVTSLGYFVTSPDAVTPMGPGPVMGGTTYWALAAASFPNGFDGPVVYGAVPANANDASEASGAPLGGAALPSGACVKLTLVFSDFSTTVVRYVVP
jgi:mono/diheme cytochrome c family protein